MTENRRPGEGNVMDQPPPIADPARQDPPSLSRFVIVVAVVAAIAIALAILLTTGVLG